MLRERTVNSRKSRTSPALAEASQRVTDAYDHGVDSTVAALLAGLLGAAVGAASVLAWRLSEAEQRAVPPAPDAPVAPAVTSVLAALRSSAVVVGPDDVVLKASAPAYALGIVRGNRLAVDALLALVQQVRRDGEIREEEFVLTRSRGRSQHHVAARVAPLGSRMILALVDDRTRERRLEAIRRDFVVNVSHELKTPIGAIALLAEAVGEAADDPAAVHRFAGRMRNESERLTRLVQQIIELSRLQGDDPLEEPAVVSVDAVLERSLDRSRVDAQAKEISLERAGEHGLEVLGSGEQILSAIGNLVENAVAYSPEGSRVVVTAHNDGSMVLLTVSDQGVGIAPTEIDRIFERFYRVDPARARTTGGTGLGLSIVKHVAATHGGDVKVWSVQGEGSSFTLSLPSRIDRPTRGSAPNAVPASTTDRISQPEEATS
jgi:two-component system sensor histidine kinase SenX3